MLRRLRRTLLIVLSVVAGVAAIALIAGTVMLRGSLPRLDGERSLPGLSAPVTVARDSLGIPDVHAVNRMDASRALGWLHAQDRFFQMDLLRRNAAGELAALFGSAALDADRDTRRHRFRERAVAVVAALDDRDRALLEAYTDGVNAGIDDLRNRPFEYLALRLDPEPWRPEDTILTICAMFLDLSVSTAETEHHLGLVRDTVPAPLASLLLDAEDRWAAPLQGDLLPERPLPTAAEMDVRTWTPDTTRIAALGEPVPRHDMAGSNNWAVAGRLTAHGGALLADDMHLGHALPNIWYRARLSWDSPEGERSVVGVTLPGTPGVIAGSNGRVAWGFTNTFGDWSDLVVLEIAPDDSTRYRTPDGWESLRRVTEVIEVAGAAPDTLVFQESRWGPVWYRDAAGRPLALRWTPHLPGGVNVALLGMEDVDTVDEAVALAPTMGIPHQNLVCADRDGRIAWTVAGRIPRRVGWDGRTPVSWAGGTCRWDGWLDADEQPRIVDPPEGRLWTANNRTLAGRDLAMVGDGGYGLGARARQIRDGLRALESPVEADMLAIQLDDRALFLGEWRSLFLDIAARGAVDDTSGRRCAFIRTVKESWDGHASPGSTGYRLVRDVMYLVMADLYGCYTAAADAVDPDFHPSSLPYRHAVARRLLSERPDHLLPPAHGDWDDVVLAAVDAAMDRAALSAGSYTWGERNTVIVRHPFAWFAPALERWLATEPVALPGDSHMPRVQHRGSGASERMVVSPGREEQGILHMPGGQSGHPLSPYFRAGHDAWAEGRPTPLLPGAARHVLTLSPD